MHLTSTDAPDETRAALLRSGVRLEQFTIGWNVLEAIVAIAAGTSAGSIALIGFGLDSVIESISGFALYRRLKAELISGRGVSEKGERQALWFVGVTFWMLAAYVGIEAVSSLINRDGAESSSVGVALAAVSLLVMPVLAWRKNRLGKQLESEALIADSKETFVCAYLSVTLLLGLVLNSWLGWWWADSAAAALMIPLMIHEGREAIEAARGDGD